MKTTPKIKRKNHVTAAVAVYLVLTRDNKILFGRRQNTGFQDGKWQVFAGHVERPELPAAAAIREAKEELGIDIAIDDLRLIHICVRPDHDGFGNRVDMFYDIRRWQGGIVNMEPHKCSEMGWFAHGAFPPDTVPHVRHCLELVNAGSTYSELDMAWLKSHYPKPA